MILSWPGWHWATTLLMQTMPLLRAIVLPIRLARRCCAASLGRDQKPVVRHGAKRAQSQPPTHDTMQKRDVPSIPGCQSDGSRGRVYRLQHTAAGQAIDSPVPFKGWCVPFKGRVHCFQPHVFDPVFVGLLTDPTDGFGPSWVDICLGKVKLQKLLFVQFPDSDPPPVCSKVHRHCPHTTATPSTVPFPATHHAQSPGKRLPGCVRRAQRRGRGTGTGRGTKSDH